MGTVGDYNMAGASGQYDPTRAAELAEELVGARGHQGEGNPLQKFADAVVKEAGSMGAAFYPKMAELASKGKLAPKDLPKFFQEVTLAKNAGLIEDKIDKKNPKDNNAQLLLRGLNFHRAVGTGGWKSQIFGGGDGLGRLMKIVAHAQIIFSDQKGTDPDTNIGRLRGKVKPEVAEEAPATKQAKTTAPQQRKGRTTRRRTTRAGMRRLRQRQLVATARQTAPRTPTFEAHPLGAKVEIRGEERQTYKGSLLQKGWEAVKKGDEGVQFRNSTTGALLEGDKAPFEIPPGVRNVSVGGQDRIAHDGVLLEKGAQVLLDGEGKIQYYFSGEFSVVPPLDHPDGTEGLSGDPIQFSYANTSLEPGWIPLKNESGATIFKHIESGDVKTNHLDIAERPAGVTKDAEGFYFQDMRLDANCVPIKNKDGESYFYNKETRKYSKDPSYHEVVPGVTEKKVGGEKRFMHAGKLVAKGWIPRKDPGSGQAYFYRGSETKWTPPYEGGRSAEVERAIKERQAQQEREIAERQAARQAELARRSEAREATEVDKDSALRGIASTVVSYTNHKGKAVRKEYGPHIAELKKKFGKEKNVDQKRHLMEDMLAAARAVASEKGIDFPETPVRTSRDAHKAYLKLARALHPDKNKGEKGIIAQVLFQNVGDALKKLR